MSRKLQSLAFALTMTAGSLAVVSPAAAAATTGTFFNQETEVNRVDGTECVDIGPGTETSTFTTSGHFTATDTGFHFEGSEAIDGTTVFDNGYHLTAHGFAPFRFDTNDKTGQTVNSSGAGTELHTIFNAQNQVIARVRFEDVNHVTYRDLNGNGQPDDGEITVSFEHFHFMCF